MARVGPDPYWGAAGAGGRSRKVVTVLASAILVVGGSLGVDRALREEAAGLSARASVASAQPAAPSPEVTSSISASGIRRADPPNPEAPEDRAAFNAAGFAEPVSPHYLEPEPPRTPIVGPPIDYASAAETGADPTALAEQSWLTEHLGRPRSAAATTE